MVRRGLEGCDILFDISRLGRKRAHSWNKESESENSDIFRLKRQIRKTKNMDEDYVQYLMLLLDYDEESKCYTNEGGNEGPAVAKDRLYHDMDEDVNEYEDDEDEDEDIDPEYKKFLANAKPNGNSYMVKIDRSVGFPVFVEFEKDDGSDAGFEYLGQRKHQDSGDEKDFGNVSCKDKVQSQPFSRIVLENDDNRSAGDTNVIFEPSDPVTPMEKGLTSKKLSLGENGECKRRRKGEMKNRSNKEQKKKRGRPAKVTTKEEGADIDEDYSYLLEKFICKNWSTTTSFMRKYNLKRKKSSTNVLENDSNISVGDINMTHEPSDPLSPKKKKKKGLMSQKNSTKGNDTSKRQGKGEKRKRSNEKQTARKGRKLAVVPLNEDVAGRKSVDVTVKEERADVDEASFKSGNSFEREAADEDLQIVVNDNCTFGKEGGSNIVEASLAKHCENVEDSFPRKTVRSDFWYNVKALLERPYDQKEYIGLWKAVKSRKPTLKDMDLRNGKFYSSRRLGKSYLDHYKDLHEKLKEVDNDNIKQLTILRGFFFWLQQTTS
ncbi:uncharacterized protein LOC129884158 isoform X2 [Solanum dulcamara]|uniref:uncharacterized protein LOC129884158 isoform X2 n=1 Tax=Solanum dulcamara TaxID=45834 RepID=UPI002485779D|nr:uncharacterized protein LOC129884158 isoform X2 [Solanum dulcamara]